MAVLFLLASLIGLVLSLICLSRPGFRRPEPPEDEKKVA